MRRHRRINTTIAAGLGVAFAVAFSVSAASTSGQVANASDTEPSLQSGPLICVYNPAIGTICAL